MNAIVTTPQPSLAYSEMERLADAIAKSSLFGIKTKEQAIVLMAIAQAEGRHPALAARDYDIVNNRPAKKAEAMMRDFVSAGGTVEWHTLTDELADATFTHPQTGSVRIDWDMKRAQTAFGKKDMYTKFPRQMLRSRVVSEGVRTLWPLATSGMYVPEEATAIPEHNGPTLEHEPEPGTREAINAEVQLKTAAANTPKAPRKVDPTVYDTPKPKPLPRTPEEWNAWMDEFQAECLSFNPTTDTRADLEAMTKGERFKAAYAAAPPKVRRDIDAQLAATHGELPEARADEPLDEVAIAGEANLAAG